MSIPKLPPRSRPLVLLALLLVVIVAGSATLTRAQAPNDPASKLLKSLTAQQRTALSAALAAYNDDLASLAGKLAANTGGDGKHHVYIPQLQLDAATAVVNGDTLAFKAALLNPDHAQTGAALDGVSSDVQTLQSTIEADLAAILTPEQMALYAEAVALAAPAQGEPQARIAQTGEFDAVGCFNAAQWTDYAFAFNRAAKAFAIMAAFNVDFGTETDEAVQSYISLNEAEAYIISALNDLSTASVLITAADTLVQNINGGTLFGVKGEASLVVAEDRINLGTDLALEDYINSGGEVRGNTGEGGNYFAFFAYAYGDLAEYFADEALTRTINCY